MFERRLNRVHSTEDIHMSLPALNAINLPAILEATGQTFIKRDTLPERVIQFGEGNFLRAFVDWMFNCL